MVQWVEAPCTQLHKLSSVLDPLLDTQQGELTPAGFPLTTHVPWPTGPTLTQILNKLM